MSATTGQPSGCGPSGGVGRNGGGGGGSGGVGPCGACKFLRRKCVAGCMFAPYFNSEEGATHFAMVHKVFGASNVTKLLQQIPEEMRMDAVFSFFYEAQARVQDPTYGCVSHILALQQQVASLQREIKYLQGHFSAMQVPIPPPQPMTMPPPPPTMANLVPAYSIQPPLGVSPIFFGPTGQEQHNQSQMQAHNPMGPTHFSFNQGGPGPSVGDFQAPLARDLVQGQAPGSFSHVPNNGHSSVPPGSG